MNLSRGEQGERGLAALRPLATYSPAVDILHSKPADYLLKPVLKEHINPEAWCNASIRNPVAPVAGVLEFGK